MSGVQMVTVKAADDGMRLDRWFRQHFPDLKHGQLQKMLRKGQVRVDGGRVQADRRIEKGEVVRVPPLEATEAKPKAPKSQQRLTADEKEFVRSLVLYEDDDILALNKPAGLAVQGGAGQKQHIDGLLDAFKDGSGERPRLVHRLDKDTGGLLLLGKSRKSAAALAEAFQRHQVLKTYWALTKGVPNPLSGRIDLAISKTGSPGAEKVTPGEGGKKAVTDFQVVETAGTKAAFVALRPTTGRTHQIRVHLEMIGTPIVGDRKYGGAEAMLEGVPPKMHLFCRSMTIPRKGKRPLTLSAPLTDHMAATWKLFAFAMPEDLEWPE